jgi:hypothetical protein
LPTTKYVFEKYLAGCLFSKHCQNHGNNPGPVLTAGLKCQVAPLAYADLRGWQSHHARCYDEICMALICATLGSERDAVHNFKIDQN